MKKLLKLLIVVTLVLVIGGIVYVMMNKNTLAKTAIEKVLSYALEVDVAIDKVKLSITEGKADVYGLKIGNPADYKSSEAISLEHIAVKLDLASASTSNIKIDRIDISGSHVNIEKRKKKMNIKQLIDNAAAFSERMSDSESEATTAVVVKKLRVDNSEVSVVTPLLPDLVNIKLPPIEMENIGSEKSVSVAQATEIFLRTLLKTSLAVAGKELPANVFDSLGEGLGFVGGQIENGQDLVEKGASKLKQGKDKLKDEAQDIKNDVKNLFKRK